MKRTQTTKGRKQTRKKGVRKFTFGLFACLFSAIVGSWTWNLWQLNTGVEAQLMELNKQKTALLEQKSILEEEIVRLNTPSYIEQLAREQLGLVRHGEIMIAPKDKE